MSTQADDPREWIKGLITDFIADSPTNDLQNQAGNRAWDQALVGFASGADPIWQQYKEYVGPFHWTPWEAFNQHQPGENATAGELTVICWVLPQRELVREANRRARKFPAEEWARVRIYGEECNAALRRHVAQALTEAGHDKEKCRQYLAKSREYVEKNYNFVGYGCGLCQVGVPCEDMIPVKAAREMYERGELSSPQPPLA